MSKSPKTSVLRVPFQADTHAYVECAMRYRKLAKSDALIGWVYAAFGIGQYVIAVIGLDDGWVSTLMRVIFGTLWLLMARWQGQTLHKKHLALEAEYWERARGSAHLLHIERWWLGIMEDASSGKEPRRLHYRPRRNPYPNPNKE